jgi:hypothetical protein
MGTSTSASLTARGTVLRDTSSGAGIVAVSGQQYPFQLEGMWRSEIPPRSGMIVEVAFSAPGQIGAITAVPESKIAKEQAEVALAAAKEKSAALAGAMIARFGKRDLIAGGLLIVGWFMLNAVSVDMGLGKLEFTFWQVLGFVNAGAMSVLQQVSGRGASAGLYGILAIAAVAGPFLHHFWKDRRAHLGAVLPLAVMLLAAIMIYSSISSAVGDAGAFGGGQEAEEARAQMSAEMRRAISMGLGTYLSLAVAGYFALGGIKRYLVSRASN